MTTPNGGFISINEGPLGQSPPTGFSFFGQEVIITAPAATPANPLTIVFVIDASIIPGGEDESTVQISKGGVVVANCNVFPGSTTAAPDPCVSNRELLGDGDVRLTVKTSTASPWNFGVTTGSHDAAVRKVRPPHTLHLTAGAARSRILRVDVRNRGDHSDDIGVYVAILPPGGIGNPFGCTPNGVFNWVSLATGGAQSFLDDQPPGPATKLTVNTDWSCTTPFAGKVNYTVKAIADHGADDFASCDTLAEVLADTCGSALAEDDDDDSDNILTRPLPIVTVAP